MVVVKDTMSGNCFECGFYKEGECKRAENSLETLVDPVCLQKLTVILLTDLCRMMNDLLEQKEQE